MKISLDEGAVVPEKSTKNSAGYDLFSLESCIIPAGCHRLINTGVHMEIPIGIVGTVSHRSGMNSKKGIQAFGQIDPDYRGPIMVTLFNAHPSKPIEINAEDRIAQIVFVQIWNPSLSVVKELSETTRGDGGHGSTGR